MLGKEKEKDSNLLSLKTTSAFSLPKELLLSNSVSAPDNPTPSWIFTSPVLCILFCPLSPPISLFHLPLTFKYLPLEISNHAKTIEIEGCMEEVVSEIGFEKWDRICLSRDKGKDLLGNP